jgi:hypothetical protein
MNTTRDSSRRTGDLSAVARSAKVEGAEADRLDNAIDAVAARLTHVEDNDALAAQIIIALPERTSRLRWLIPQFAAIGAIAIAALVWTTRSTPPAIARLPAANLAPTTGFANVVAANEPGPALRTFSLEPLEPVEPLESLDGDHERSLPAIAAMHLLDFDSLAPVSLPEDARLTLEPLAIADLPLTADGFSPR